MTLCGRMCLKLHTLMIHNFQVFSIQNNMKTPLKSIFLILITYGTLCPYLRNHWRVPPTLNHFEKWIVVQMPQFCGVIYISLILKCIQIF